MSTPPLTVPGAARGEQPHGRLGEVRGSGARTLMVWSAMLAACVAVWLAIALTVL